MLLQSKCFNEANLSRCGQNSLLPRIASAGYTMYILLLHNKLADLHSRSIGLTLHIDLSRMEGRNLSKQTENRMEWPHAAAKKVHPIFANQGVKFICIIRKEQTSKQQQQQHHGFTFFHKC